MKEIVAPNALPQTDLPRVFLAGSIEMGAAEKWQDKMVKRLSAEDIIIFNPRRPDWDDSWVQSKDNPIFKEQVEWELNALSKSDYIILYFDPNTKSPITLLEIGLYAASKKLMVVCPEGFWRKGNIDIVCEKYGFPQFDSLDELSDYFINFLKRV